MVTFSWQKVLGGEAAHGMLILSPRAVERLESYTPAWPLPKIFRLTKGGKLNEGIFEGETINTPSMLCVEDYLDALAWAKSVGGLPALMRAPTPICRASPPGSSARLGSRFSRKIRRRAPTPRSASAIVDPAVAALSPDAQAAFIKAMAAALEKENAAYDVAGHRDAPPGLRIWGGATVEGADLDALFPWLDWAFGEAKAALAKAA